MLRKYFSERTVILVTAGLIVISGLIQMINYGVGISFYYIVFGSFLAYRLIRILHNRKKVRPTFQRYRLLLFFIMLVSLTFNIMGWQQADFFLIFLLMVDFLLVVNRKLR